MFELAVPPGAVVDELFGLREGLDCEDLRPRVCEVARALALTLMTSMHC